MLGVGVPLRPVVCNRYHAEVVADDAVAFVSENGSALVRDPIALRVVPLIDGRRTTDEIAAHLSISIDPRRVHESLGAMVRAGLVVEAADMPAAMSALWSEIGVSEFRATQMLESFTLGIESLTDIPLRALYEALDDFGFTVTSDADVASVRIVLVDDYLDPRLADVDARARGNAQSWFLVKPTGVNVWAGPRFVPGQTACWHCLAERLRRNRPVDHYLHGRQDRSTPLPTSRARSRMAAHHAFSMAVTQIARSVGYADGERGSESILAILETLRLAVSWHAVVRRPQCRGCGDPTRAGCRASKPDLQADPAPVVLRDGREHLESPEVVFGRFAHLISPVTGVVSAVVPSPWNARSPLRSYSAGHNAALANDSLQVAGDSLRLHSSGKGRTDAQARTSALCEALERASGVYTGDEPSVTDSLIGLGDAAIDPRDCMLFSERQYRERERWLAQGNGFQVVPQQFDAAMRLEWSPVWSLTQARVRYLPSSYLYYGYPREGGRFVALADSNGNAAGVTFVDACLQGLYELIERDCVAVWWYNRIRRPGVDLDGLEPAWIADLRAFYARIGRELWLLDLSSDLGIPAFAALTRRLDGPTEDIVIGFGAHHDPCVAAGRALTEMNQFMPAVIDVGADGKTQYHVHDPETLRWWTTARVADQPYLRPLTAVTTSLVDRARGPEPIDADERFQTVIDTLERCGFEVLVLDQTRPDIGLPVAKVIVPGLRHYWARFAPGRLYDVPVQLGWLGEPTPEEQLNPIAMFV